MTTKTRRTPLRELIAEIEKAEAEQDELIPAPGQAGAGEPPITNKMVEIVRILQGNLMLCEPTLNWLQQKRAELAGAQLSVLFSPEELAEKRKQMK